MSQRYGLVVFLFCFSLGVGISIVFLEKAAVFFFSLGLAVLSGTIVVLLAAVSVSWLVLKRQRQSRDPEHSLRRQSRAFAAWFAFHNLVWAFVAALFIWGLVKLFGFKPWVMALCAGALACACFALAGTFLNRKWEMLGLCWQSRIPEGLSSFWARAGSALILGERYEYAAQHDQNQPTPTLWSISRIFNRSQAGGADRPIDLLEPNRDFLAAKLKREGLYRLNVLLVLFLATAVLAVLSGLLGFVSPSWDRVPGDWPGQKQKSSQPEKPQIQASNTKIYQDKENSGSRENSDGSTQEGDSQKQVSPDQKKSSASGGSGSESGRGSETANTSDQGGQADKTGQESAQTASSLESNSKEKGSEIEDKNSRTGESGGEEQAGKKESNHNRSTEARQGEGDAGQEQKSNRSENKDRGRGESPGTEKETTQPGGNDSGEEKSNRGQQGAGQDKGGKEQDQANSKEKAGLDPAESGKDGSGQDQDSQKNRGKGQGGNSGPGRDKGEGSKNGQQGDSKKPGKEGGAGKDRGEGQGTGDPDVTPEIRSKPEPLPKIPSRTTEMVTLELPTLEEGGSPDKENKDPRNKPPRTQFTPAKRPAPTSPATTGKQERPAAKPEQYLPNWILNLLKRESADLPGPAQAKQERVKN